MSAERVLIREYDTTDDAKAAESMLIESGANDNMVFRTGKKLRVIASYETRARELLGETPNTAMAAAMTDAGIGFGDPLVGSTTTGMDAGSMSSTTTSGQGGGSTTDSMKQAASSATDTVQQAASSAAGTAQQAASTVTDTAQQAASTVADTVQQAASTVGDTAQQAASATSAQVSRVTGGAADAVQSLADTVEQRGAGPNASGVQRSVAVTTSNVLDKLAQYLRQPDLTIIAQDLRGAVRRNPGRSLLVGLGLGYLARGTVFSGQGGGQSSQTTTSGTDVATTDLATTGAATTDATFSDTGATGVYDYDTTATSATAGLGGTGLMDVPVEPVTTDVYGAAVIDDFSTGTDPYGTDPATDDLTVVEVDVLTADDPLLGADTGTGYTTDTEGGTSDDTTSSGGSRPTV